jgi:hypothetical protein
VFHMHKIKGKKYLFIEKDGGVHVVDEDGNNYGTWQSIENFRDVQFGKSIYVGNQVTKFSASPLGKCKLVVRVIDPEPKEK